MYLRKKWYKGFACICAGTAHQMGRTRTLDRLHLDTSPYISVTQQRFSLLGLGYSCTCGPHQICTRHSCTISFSNTQSMISVKFMHAKKDKCASQCVNFMTRFLVLSGAPTYERSTTVTTVLNYELILYSQTKELECSNFMCIYLGLL